MGQAPGGRGGLNRKGVINIPGLLLASARGGGRGETCVALAFILVYSEYKATFKVCFLRGVC